MPVFFLHFIQSYAKIISMQRTSRYLNPRNILLLFAILLSAICLPRYAYACEPLYPFLFRFVFPSSMAGSAIGLLAGVSVKCILFAFLVKNLKWFKAVFFMFIANIVTSIFGIAMAVTISALPMSIILIPLICYIATLPSRSLRKRMADQLPEWLYPGAVAGFLFFAVPLSGMLFYAAEFADTHTGHYWFFKLGYIYAGLAVGIGMTTLWEEWLVFGMSEPKSETHFLPAVLRTNLYTFLLLALIGAVYALPQRLSHPGFLLLDK